MTTRKGRSCDRIRQIKVVSNTHWDREFIPPYYKRIARIADPHGIDIRWMDSDADIRQLIPLRLECGVNLLTPLEAAAGVDVAALRAEAGAAFRASRRPPVSLRCAPSRGFSPQADTPRRPAG